MYNQELFPPTYNQPTYLKQMWTSYYILRSELFFVSWASSINHLNRNNKYLIELSNFKFMNTLVASWCWNLSAVAPLVSHAITLQKIACLLECCINNAQFTHTKFVNPKWSVFFFRKFFSQHYFFKSYSKWRYWALPILISIQ